MSSDDYSDDTTSGMSSDYSAKPIIQLSKIETQYLADAAAIGVTVLLAFGFLTAATRYRLWHNNIFLRNFLGLASNPLYQWLVQLALLTLNITYDNQFYVIWAVLLFIGFGSFYSILSYTQFGGNRAKVMQMNERLQLSNNIVMLLFLLISMDKFSRFYGFLYAIWGLYMFKIIEKMRSLSVANRLYGEENTKLVVLHMSKEHKVNRETNPVSMIGYKYLLMGEEIAHAGQRAGNYDMEIQMDKAITVDEAWTCKGRLLKSDGGDPEGRLKDLCLSFSLFKLIKRRFQGYPTAESGQPKTRAFILEGLLANGEERPFRVIDAELRFLRDLFYTKYPVTFGFGFPIFDILQFLLIGLSFSGALLTIMNSDYPERDNNNKVYGWDIDLTITIVILSLVVLMEVWEFISYLFSDWAKIILLCKYMKQWKWSDLFFLDKVLQIMCSVNLWGISYNTLGQYNLLKSAEERHLYFLYWLLTCGYRGKRIPGCSCTAVMRKPTTSVSVTRDVKKAICNSLNHLKQQGEQNISNGSETLKRYALHADMAWACGEGVHKHTLMHTIMIWHIATCFLENDFDHKSKMETGLSWAFCSKNHKSKMKHKDLKTATSLSNYCAYLVVFAPELLPIDDYSSRYVFKKVFDETREYLRNHRKAGAEFETMESDKIEAESQTMIVMGARLRKELTGFIGDEAKRWKVLAEFWAELILFLAPSENSRAHERKLAEGGEFITHLWALLFHAGITKQRRSIEL